MISCLGVGFGLPSGIGAISLLSPNPSLEYIYAPLKKKVAIRTKNAGTTNTTLDLRKDIANMCNTTTASTSMQVSPGND